MNDTHKLLLAFIEASGFDVEEIKTPKGQGFKSFAVSPGFLPVIKCGDELYRAFDTDYKVTKKEDDDFTARHKKIAEQICGRINIK